MIREGFVSLFMACTGCVAYTNWDANFTPTKWDSEGWVIDKSAVVEADGDCMEDTTGTCWPSMDCDVQYCITAIVDPTKFTGSSTSIVTIQIWIGGSLSSEKTGAGAIFGVADLAQHSKCGDVTNVSVVIFSDTTAPILRYISAEGILGCTACDSATEG